MEQIIKDLLFQAGAYGVAFLLGLFVINFLSNGFLWKYLIVKASRGKKVMVEFVSVQRSYWRTGKIIEALLYTKKSGAKDKTLLPVTREDFRRLMTIDYIIIDEKTNTILRADFTTKNQDNFDWVDNLLVRALEKPQIKNDLVTIFMFLLLIIILVVVGYEAYKLQGIEALIKSIPTIGVVNP